MNQMQVFHPANVLGGGLYFTTERTKNEYDRRFWEDQGYRVVFITVDPATGSVAPQTKEGA